MTEGAKPAWELETEARAITATDWEPMAGMVGAGITALALDHRRNALHAARRTTEGGIR